MIYIAYAAEYFRIKSENPDKDYDEFESKYNIPQNKKNQKQYAPKNYGDMTE